jgi:6-phosphogluconolactonase/glucosamine-6-phosphate isomerase/deaminase
LKAAMEGPVSPDVPASLLRTAQNVTVIADRAALGMG